MTFPNFWWDTFSKKKNSQNVKDLRGGHHELRPGGVQSALPSKKDPPQRPAMACKVIYSCYDIVLWFFAFAKKLLFLTDIIFLESY